MSDHNVVARGSGVTLPHENPPAVRVPKKCPLPCYVILVHGVNDVGEAYDAQEKGLCWGLAERLDRNHDLKPGVYATPKREDASQSAIRQANDPPAKVDPAFEKHGYRRVLGPDCYTPVIPFYWGFREEDGQIKQAEETWHGELLDRDGNRLDGDGAKGGGAFVNAANCLPHMWAPGWKPPIPGLNLFTSLSDKTHPLLKATCYRHYQVLAALRLAMVIRILHKRRPEAAINVVAHSMGCLVALLAQAFLMEDGDNPAHCLVLNNPPYSFEENPLDGHLYQGINQTSRARIETLNRIVKAFKDRQAKGPSLEKLQKEGASTGLAGSRWGFKKNHASGGEISFTERDNRGKVYLYFTPHDQTVAVLNTQGIGWQGVPDSYTAEWKDTKGEKIKTTWTKLMGNLGTSGFRQRLFMQRQRGGVAYQVGLPPGQVSLKEGGEIYGSGIKTKSLPKGTLRFINGEPLSPPIPYDPGPDVLPISPIDAAVALTNNGSCYFTEEIDDPRPVNERKAIIHSNQWEPIRWKLNEGKPKAQQIPRITDIMEITDARNVPTGKLLVTRYETPEETRYRLQTFGTSENSHHSSIVSNHWHSQAVTAFDLALGEPIPWTEREKMFFDYICEIADWRIKTDDSGTYPKVDDKLRPLTKTGFYADENHKNKALIEDTAIYYVKGDLPPQVMAAKTADKLSLIHFETTGNRSSNLINS